MGVLTKEQWREMREKGVSNPTNAEDLFDTLEWYLKFAGEPRRLAEPDPDAKMKPKKEKS